MGIIVLSFAASFPMILQLIAAEPELQQKENHHNEVNSKNISNQFNVTEINIHLRILQILSFDIRRQVLWLALEHTLSWNPSTICDSTTADSPSCDPNIVVSNVFDNKASSLCDSASIFQPMAFEFGQVAVTCKRSFPIPCEVAFDYETGYPQKLQNCSVAYTSGRFTSEEVILKPADDFKNVIGHREVLIKNPCWVLVSSNFAKPMLNMNKAVDQLVLRITLRWDSNLPINHLGLGVSAGNNSCVVRSPNFKLREHSYASMQPGLNQSNQSSNQFSSLFLSAYNQQGLLTMCLSIPMCCIGVTAHALVVICTLRSRSSSKHQAAPIIASSSLAEGILSLYWGLWLPLTFWAQKPLGSTGIMFTGTICFLASVNSDLLLAFNRFMAVCRPLNYRWIFTSRWILIYIGGIWIAATICSIPFGIPGCRIIDNYKMLQLTFEETACGQGLKFGSEVFGGMSVVPMVLNVLTFRKLRKSGLSTGKSLNDKESKRRSQAEHMFFAQSCVTSTTMSLVVPFVGFFSIPFHDRWTLFLSFHDRWTLFLLTCLCPLSLLSIDGVVLLFLNESVRSTLSTRLRHVCRLKRVQPIELGSCTVKRATNNQNRH